METLKLEIVTPTGVLFDDEVKMVTVPGKEGEFGILPHHASLISIHLCVSSVWVMMIGSFGL